MLSSVHSKVDAYGCCFSESPLAVVSLRGGDHRFVQCTVADNYLFSAVTQPNLTLSYCLPDESNGRNPLMKAVFENCIVYGIGESLTPGDLTGSDVFFRNVLFKADGSDDSNFSDCLWNTDPLFLTVREDYVFDYRVAEDSPAVGAGNPLYVTPICQTDMDGVDRLAKGNPTLGAYAE